MIVGAGGVAGRGRQEIVRAGTLLETVRGGRYSPNMCSPDTDRRPAERLTEEGTWTSSRT